MLHCKVDDVDVHYTIKGDGPPLFLSYCLGGNLGMWGDEITVLAQQHTVVLWDPRGHGGTTSPSDPSQYGVNRSASDLLALMDHLGFDKAIVGGVSMGGGSAACFAGRFPERTQAALIMDSNTAAGLPVPEKVIKTREHTISLCGKGDMHAVAEYFLATSPAYQLFAAKSPDNEQRLRDMVASMDPVGFANTLCSMLSAETSTDDLKKITSPTLVLAGDNDPAMKAIELTADVISHSQFKTIANAGHLSNIDNPAQFAQSVLAFTRAVS